MIHKEKGQVMFKLSNRLLTLLAIITTFFLLCWQSLAAENILADSTPLPQPTLIATAPTAPNLETAILGGEPISVLYITRAADSVLVRCYPGYQPIMEIRSMGSDPDANTQKEGVVTCQPALIK